MAIAAHRWLMTAVKAPLVRAAFDAAPGAPGEVTVEIAGCGLCHTDLGYYYDGVRTNHPLPLALGHEIAGTRRRRRPRRRIVARQGGGRALGDALRRMRSLQARQADDLPEATHAGERHSWWLRQPRRRAGARPLPGR
jgi:hypothetical protein